MLPDFTPPSLPPNKLVKRSSSLRSTNGSPASSRLPIPVFKRPATSHSRSAAFYGTPSGADQSYPASEANSSQDLRDFEWKHYFTPKVAANEVSSAKRRSSSGIPNPIKRIYPDRKYTPVLVSGKDYVKRSQVEADDGLDYDESGLATTKLRMAPAVASSPVVAGSAGFDDPASSRRSFSFSDLLSTGPQPLWRRPSSSKSNTSKLARKGGRRVVSAPHSTMGGSVSSASRNDVEPPAKRRDLTNPVTSQRSIYSSSSSTQPSEAYSPNEIQLNLASETSHIPRPTQRQSLSTNNASQTHQQSQFEQRRLPSATFTFSDKRPPRLSAAHSEVPSTVGSDSEYRSVGDMSTDYQSDTVYDSYPTRTTRSSSGRRGPPIETIFDESPPMYSSGRSTKLKDLLNDDSFPNSVHSDHYRYSTIEEEEGIATPVRSLRDQNVTSSPAAHAVNQGLFNSSPPAILEMPDPDEMDWDAPEDAVPALPAHPASAVYQAPNNLDINIVNHVPQRSIPFHLSPFAPTLPSGSLISTPQRNGASHSDRATIFDWSEAQPSPSHINQSPPRPKTVHGKKDPENRGSRSAARRAPSGMHARSHSVPVVPDVEGKRSNAVANKFGTWGVGSKAVTEDWNEDFDFDESPVPPVPAFGDSEEKRIDSGHAMFVPRSIREQQESVVANISLLREWGLLIEELKELRIRAVALDMLHGPYAPAWQEVDAMIELADQETAEDTLEPRKSPPSSPGFDLDAFDEPLPTIANTSRPRRPSTKTAEPTIFEHEMQDDFETGHQEMVSPARAILTRPRKDSEAVARSVIEALQSKRSVSDPTALKPVAPSKKVPFDTATLRHIVPYVNGLKRKVKDALRETEGLYSSPRRRVSPDDTRGAKRYAEEPAFLSTFNEPQPGSPTAARKARRSQAATDHDGSEQPMDEHHDDLTQRMQRMGFGPPQS